MKQILLLISIVLLFFTANVNAQLKPAQSQYLVEKGVLINPSFEQGYKGWVITGCTKSLVTETPYLDKSLKLTCTNETFSIKQVSASLIDFKNQQGAFDLQIKTTASGVNVSSITNGARDNAYSVLDSTTFKRFKEIGFIVGDTDNGVEIYSDTNFTGEIIVDNFKLGLGNLTQEISAAHFVGSLNYNSTNCLWQSGLTPFQDFPVDADCTAQNIKGNVAAPDTKIPAIKILNARTDGYYKVVFSGIYGGSLNFGGYIALSDFNGQNTEQATTYLQDTKVNYNNSLFGNFRFNSTSDVTIRMVAQVSAGILDFYARGNNEVAKFTVHFFPDSKNTIAVQKSQSPNYAGFLSFSFMDGDLQGHLPADGRCVAKNLYPDYDKRVANLYGDCDAGTGANTGYNLPDMRGYFPRMVDTTSEGTAGVNPDNTLIGGKQADQNVSHVHGIRTSASVNQTGTTIRNDTGVANIRTINSFAQGGNEARPSAISLMAYVRMSDNNLVVGSFEQIRSDDLSVFLADIGATKGIATSSLTYITFDNVKKDTNLEFDVGTGTFTAKKDMTVEVDTQLYFGSFTATSTLQLQIHKNGSVIAERQKLTHTTNFNWFNSVTKTVDLLAGDTIRIQVWQNSGATRNISIDFRSYLSIKELPTKESIVANLMQGQTTKCQTKFLSANVSTNANLADLSFSGLDITKKYRVNIFARYQPSETDTMVLSVDTLTDRLCSTFPSGVIGHSGSSFKSCLINPTDSTLTASSASINGNLLGGSTSPANNTSIELCQLPDTVIETTEFN